MWCISSVQYKVLINGEASHSFKPSCGIRQGDPLSPYIFVLCMEKLSHLITQKVSLGLWKCVKVSRGGPSISHLFFADVILIFCKASMNDCNSLQCTIKVYEDAFGQQLNRAKTSLFFSCNTDIDKQEEIKTRFGTQIIT